MSQIAINTSQNVNIDFKLASVGERMGAFAIDMAIKIAFLLMIKFIFYDYINIEQYLGDYTDYWSQVAIFIILTFPVYIYTLVCESIMEGQTFGKKVLKIKVVKIDGYQANFSDYFMRWVFRLVDIYTNMGMVGLISIIVTKNNQRLGGISSGTAVISLKNNINISHTILENISTDYSPTFPQVVALSDNDMRIIKDNYQKAVKLDDKEIIHKLSEKIKVILKIDKLDPQFTEKKFINTVIKDYNYYTGKD